MMRFLPLLLAISACNSENGQPSPEAPQSPSPGVSAAPANSALTGLYEGAPGEQTSQLCMIGKNETEAAFGLVVWGSNMHSCSGTGTATLSGGKLRLAMTGDSECAIDASLADGKLTLPASIPEGCSYYCGARASLSGATFTRKAGTREAALQAKDLVGDSLCQGL